MALLKVKFSILPITKKTIHALVLLTTVTAALSACTPQVKRKSPAKTLPATESVPMVTITAPTTASVISNQTSINISGTCMETLTVKIAGDLNSTANCTSGAFTFSHTPPADGTFHYSVTQSNASNTVSSAKEISWTRDTLPPNEVQITAPASNPYFSGDNDLIISGTCEIGGTVYFEDSPNQNADCLLGTFSFTTNRTLNDAYNFNLMQKDAADNSSAIKLLQWVRDDSLPPTPTVTTPIAYQIANNLDSVTISGGCVTGYTVTLSGDQTDSQVCLSSMYSFTVNQSTDSVYHFGIKQTSLSAIDSAEAVVTWERDTLTPSAPTITTPGSNPFSSGDTGITLSGTCETGNTVNLTGDSTANQICSNAQFTFLISKSGNTTYHFSLTQTDHANNQSSSTAFTWNQDTNKPATPVITTPATAVHLSNTSTLNIIGSCKTGNTVYLTGDSTQDMLCANNAFQFTVSASSGDQTYNFAVKQKSAINNLESGESSLSWTSDTTPPSTPALTSVTPISPSSSLTPKIKGTTDAGSIIKVYRSQTCTGTEMATVSATEFTGNGVTTTITANDSYDFSVKAFDTAGNASTCSSTYLTYVNRRAVMVNNLRTQGSDGSSPSSYFPFNGYLYFRAFNANTGYELLRTDGTAAGTGLFKNFSIQGDGIPASSSAVYAMNGPYAVGSVFYFAATDDNNGTELWKSDGTVSGTTMVKDIFTGEGSSNPNGFFAVGSTLYFKADEGTNGEELWKTDGTAEGTSLVKDINPNSGVGSGITYMAALGTTLIFFADDGTNGLEPWISNGTEAGTQILKNINTTAGTGSSPSGIVVMNGYAYFNGLNSTNGAELWKTDGTTAGTTVIDITPGTGGSLSSSAVYLTAVGNTLYFRGYDTTNGYEIWKTDGTVAGSSMVKNINTDAGVFPATPARAYSNPFNFRDSGNGFIYFVATDAAHGVELWRTDGTSAGTTLIKDISTGTTSTTFSTTYFNVYGGKLYFTATTPEQGGEPWVSDGTEAGTFNLKDIYPGTSGSSNGYFVEFQSKVFFTASDMSAGSEIYTTDGTSAGTGLFKDLNLISSGSPNNFVTFGNQFLFSGISGEYGRELYISDGTAAGTTFIKDINPGDLSSSPSGFFVDGTKAYFSAFDNINGSELWVTDGTPAGTSLLKDINPNSSSSSPNGFIKLGSKIVFIATNDTEGKELWTTDGTTAGTTILTDLYAGTSNSAPAYLTVMGSTLYFYAATAANGYEIWKTDGTAAGTTLVKDIYAGTTSSSPSYFTVLGGNKLIFKATTSTSTGTGAELWISDGTTAGTTILKDINPGNSSSTPTNLKLLNDKVIFTATTPAAGTELWITDGTEAGTTIVKDIRPGTASSSIAQLAVIGSKLYFQANDGTNGTELWVSDGTPDGTYMIKNIAPGAGGSGPIYFTDIGNGIVVFRAQDGVNGWELWRTDGTEANTYLVQDINPFGGSYLSVLFYWNNKLFFQPNDGVNGYELWSY